MEYLLYYLPEALFSLGIITLVMNFHQIKTSTVVSGEIVGFQIIKRPLVGFGDQAGRIAVTPFPMVTFFDQLERKQSATINAISSTGTVKIGDKLQILYHPATPDKAVAKSYAEILKTSSVLTVIGILSVAVKYTA